MSIRVFGLDEVPHDEAMGVRQALDDAGIEFFETPPGWLGQSSGIQGHDAAAIWVADDAAVAARIEIERFQEKWRHRVRSEAGASPIRPHDPLAIPLRLVIGAFALFMLYQVFRMFTQQ